MLTSQEGTWPSYQPQKACEYFSVVKSHRCIQSHSVVIGSQLRWLINIVILICLLSDNQLPARKWAVLLVSPYLLFCLSCSVLTLLFIRSTDKYSGQWESDKGGARERGNRCWKWIGHYHCQLKILVLGQIWGRGSGIHSVSAKCSCLFSRRQKRWRLRE